MQEVWRKIGVCTGFCPGTQLHAVFAHETPTHRSAVHIKKELAGEFLGASDDGVVWSIDAKPARDFIRGGVIT